MSNRSNNKGIVFVTSLIFALVSMILLLALMHMIQASTQISGSIKRYTSAIEAAKAGVEEFVLSVRLNDFYSTAWVPGHECKLEKVSSDWPVVCGDICGSCCYSFSSPSDIISDGCYDWRKSYGDYIVYAKIVDAKLVNSVDDSAGWLYAIEVVAQSSQTNEISWYSVLYKVQ